MKIPNRNLVAAGALLHDITEVAEIIKKHGLAHLEDTKFVPQTWEEKAIFYADKRVRSDKIVSIN